MQEVFIEKLQLSNYRNFQHLTIEAECQPIILIGENGSGKTNILESISLFSPGKGLRSAKFDEICSSNNPTNGWSIQSNINSKLGSAHIVCNFDSAANKRSIEFNGARVPASDLAKFTSMIWLTPQMEGIFLGASQERRKFLDRIVYNFLPEHAADNNKYEYYMRERSKILQHDYVEETWLSILESKMADYAVKIATSRVEIISLLQEVLDGLTSQFPKAKLEVDGVIEEKIVNKQQAELVNWVKQELQEARDGDRLAGRTNFGVHRSDLLVTHQSKNQLAKYCSTGEQKAMLISIALAQILALSQADAFKPILLLDEIFVHLDEIRRDYLSEFLLSHGGQIWVTTTDEDAVSAMLAKSQIIYTNDFTG